jgi:hypothetical protein
LAGVDDDSDEDGQGEGELQVARTNHIPASNDHVKAIAPEGEAGRRLQAVKPDYVAKVEHTAFSEVDLGKEEVESPIQVDDPKSILQPGEGDDGVLKMPGSFDLSGPPGAQGLDATWSDLLRRLTN